MKISDGFKVMERAQFSYEKFQRAIIRKKNVGGVTVLVLCKLSNGALYLVQLS